MMYAYVNRVLTTPCMILIPSNTGILLISSHQNIPPPKSTPLFPLLLTQFPIIPLIGAEFQAQRGLETALHRRTSSRVILDRLI